jgi:hypothetical protein
MEMNSWSVHSDMENIEKPAQNIKKRRSQSDKIGRLKYNQQLLKQTLAEVEEFKLMLCENLQKSEGQLERCFIF